METIVCYKVVYKDQSICGRINPVCFYSYKNYIITYKIGETAYPKIGKLYCIDSIYNANLFLKDYFIECQYAGRDSQDYKILRGLATNPKKMKYSSYFYFDIESFWREIKRKKRVLKLKDALPKGSICVDSFKPTEVCQLDYP